MKKALLRILYAILIVALFIYPLSPEINYTQSTNYAICASTLYPANRDYSRLPSFGTVTRGITYNSIGLRYRLHCPALHSHGQ